MGLKYFLVAIVGLALTACSGGGGSGGGGSAGSSGILSLPTATCGGADCMASAGLLSAKSSNSSVILMYSAEYAYDYLRLQFIPEFNSRMKQIENLFQQQGYDKCGGTPTDVITGAPQMNQIPNATYPLSAEYTVVVSDGDKTAPYATEKKFLMSFNGSAFLEVQLYCPNETTRAMYVRLHNAGNSYEAWGYEAGSQKAIYAAADVAAGKSTIYFKSSSANVFEVAAVLKDWPVSGMSNMSLGISGGVNFAGVPADGIIDLQMSQDPADVVTASSTGATYDANVPVYVGDYTRHCYSNTTSIITGAGKCAGLFNGPSAVELRGNTHASSDWSVNDLGSAAIDSF